nr:hypothetical protein [Allosalinactinospora lopnorensis]
MSLWPPRRSTRHSGKRRRRGAAVIAAAAVLLAGTGGGVAVWAWRSASEGSSTEEASVPGPFAGTWSGRMSQEDAEGDHVIDWGTRVELEAGAKRGSSEWYTLDCRGGLALSGQEEDRLFFDYVETYDPEDRCVDEAELVLRAGEDEGELEAKWSATSQEGTSMTSTGTLR